MRASVNIYAYVYIYLSIKKLFSNTFDSTVEWKIIKYLLPSERNEVAVYFVNISSIKM